ncbi:16S rRNA G966 N2-methylase RsmD [Pseudarthrobacter sulfonivorans]|nr:16S rRNA G966 N2-methylase RsmD [Pseudarthrobacter sulfonivorans]
MVCSAGGGANGLESASRYASAVIGAVFTIDEARAPSVKTSGTQRAGPDGMSMR